MNLLINLSCDIQERFKNFCSKTFKDDELFNGARNFLK